MLKNPEKYRMDLRKHVIVVLEKKKQTSLNEGAQKLPGKKYDMTVIINFPNYSGIVNHILYRLESEFNNLQYLSSNQGTKYLRK